MTIDRSLILKLETLTRLELNEAERERLTGSLNDILTMVDKLQEVNTEGVAPLVYINEEPQVLRQDHVKNQLPRTEALSNAPDHNGTYFKVPKVIDL
jgi:aspartyl-tRNA(Asn)/glutamyl-tRNA(Gln) amidotransferase subunit C